MGILRTLRDKAKRATGTGKLTQQYGIEGAQAVNRVLRGKAGYIDQSRAAQFMGENPDLLSKTRAPLTRKYR